MATSWADHVMPWNGQVEAITALEIWPAGTTAAFLVPSQLNFTSLVPPIVLPVGSTMVKLLRVVPGQIVVLTVYTHPVAVLHVSVVQRLLSLHLAAKTQLPFAVLQESFVQRLLSLHTLGVKTQLPFAVLQVSTVQRLLSLQTLGVKTQAPVEVLHESIVQRLLSLQTIGSC